MFITRNPIRWEQWTSAVPGRGAGAVATFVGVVRDQNEGRPVKKLFYEAYEQLAEAQIARILEETKQETGAEEIRALHRIGWLNIGDIAVSIWVSAAHRAEAFGACRTVIERIKTEVSIWKKEYFADGSSAWVYGCHPAAHSGGV